MRLYELEDPNSLVNKIIVVTDQLKTDLDNGDVSPDWTVQDLLQYFQNYDVILDKTDLYNMIQKPPLNKVINNIEGDQVVFKGLEMPDTENAPGENEKVVQQMAQNALQK